MASAAVKTLSQVMSSNTQSILVSGVGSGHIKGQEGYVTAWRSRDQPTAGVEGLLLSSRIFCVNVLCTFKYSTSLGIPVLGSRKTYPPLLPFVLGSVFSLPL